MPGGYDVGPQFGQIRDRATRRRPIRCVISRGAMHFLSLSQNSEGGFLGHGDKRIASQERAVGIAEQRDVTGRVTGRMHPAPAGHRRNAAVGGQRPDATTEVNGAARIEAGQKGHRAPSDGRIGRRIARLPGEVGHLQLMGVDRHVPKVGQFRQCPDVIEMAMRQDDGRRPRLRAEALRRRTSNPWRTQNQSGVHHCPGAIGRLMRADEVEVDDGQLHACHVRSDF